MSICGVEGCQRDLAGMSLAEALEHLQTHLEKPRKWLEEQRNRVYPDSWEDVDPMTVMCQTGPDGIVKAVEVEK